MKRISSKSLFRGEADPNQEGTLTASEEHDQVILNVVGGAVSFVVPSNVADADVTQEKYLERFVNCTLQLENGAQILIWISAGTYGAEVQIEPPRAPRRLAKKLKIAEPELLTSSKLDFK